MQQTDTRLVDVRTVLTILITSALVLLAWACLVGTASGQTTQCCIAGKSWPCNDTACKGPMGLTCPPASIIPIGAACIAPTPTPTPLPGEKFDLTPSHSFCLISSHKFGGVH